VEGWGWIIRRVGVPTLLSLALLVTVLGSVALGLADLVRDLHGSLLLPLAAFGVLWGWLLAKSPLPGWLGGVMAFILGVEVLLVRLGGLGRPLVALSRALPGLAWGVWRWPWDGPPDGASLELALTRLDAGLNRLLAHARDWSPGGDFDPLVMTFIWGLALWVVAAWAGWAVRRHNWALRGIIPAGLLLAISLSYTRVDHYALPMFVGAAWLLIALTGYLGHERRWQATQTDYSTELRFDVAAMAGFLALTLMMVATVVPSFSVRSIARSARQLVVRHLGDGEQVADSLGIRPGSVPVSVPGQGPQAGLPRRHLLGARPELSQQVVMMVHPDEGWPELPPDQPQPRYYWRSYTYDVYTGHGWRVGPIETVRYKAGEAATLALERPFQQTVRQEVRAVGSLGGRLYVTGELVTADQDYQVAWRSPQDAFGAEIEATVYQADSRVSLVSEAELRAARDDYPDWVRDRYLALPDGTPERVSSLAHDLTAAEPTDYDQARAIERHLRMLPYTLDLPEPPIDQDVADYFLFDLQRGYCDYYATTMAVLARAAGLPARMVSGYASGTYDAARGRYVVTEANAHSWVEVYFSGYGWVEFEPTAGRLLIERPAEAVALEASSPLAALKPAAGRRIPMVWWVALGALGALGTLTLGSLTWWAVDGWRLRRMPPATTVTMLYQRLYRHGRRLAAPVETGSTPHEFKTALAERVIALTQGRRWASAPASVTQRLGWLTDLYVRKLYSPHAPVATEQAQAIKTWRQLRRQLWLAWLWKKVKNQ
jgi:transglutaminase-like putative cysteine protease